MLGAFLDALELVLPEPLVGLDPFVHGAEFHSVDAVQASAAVAGNADEADLAEDVIDFDLNDWGNSSAIEPGTVEKNVFSYEGVAGSGSLGSTPIFGIVLVYLRVDGLIFTIEVTMALDSNGDALTPDENAYNLTMQYLDVGV